MDPHRNSVQNAGVFASGAGTATETPNREKTYHGGGFTEEQSWRRRNHGGGIIGGGIMGKEP